MILTPNALAVLVEALREYRLRHQGERRTLADSLIVHFLAQLTKEGDDAR